MTFVHGWILLLELVVVAWVVYSWRSTRRHSGLLLKGCSFAAILLALSEPVMTVPETHTATLVLADTSDSVSEEDLAHESELIHQMQRSRGSNWMRVVPFSRQTRALLPKEIADGVKLVRTSSAAGGGTDIEAALLDGMAAIPAGFIPRIVLLSDGNENQGSTIRAIGQLARLGVPVDTIPLAGRSGKQLKLLSLSMPREAYAGEQIPISLRVEAPHAAHGSVDISAEGKHLGRDAVELTSGLNTLRMHARVDSTGVTVISGTMHADGVGDVQFQRAIDLKRASVVYLSQDPPEAATNLLQAFKEAQFDLTTDWKSVDSGLRGVQLVVLNNLDLEALSPDQKAKIEKYVNGGGGLLLIGGERQVYKDDKRMDALDRALPAKLIPPQMPEGICVVLIVDKSSSMEGRKIELARLSASGVVDHLRPVDSIGVLMFDNSYEWAVPVRQATNKGQIKQLISGITPDGGTQIAPALSEGYRKVLLSRATSKHIVLLTDGISEEGDSVELAKEALSRQVTISTVGLGQDVNRSYLEKVANASGGKSYFLNEPQGLQQILLKDVEDYTGKTVVEKQLVPLVQEKAQILEGVGMDKAPALKGYARFSAKQGAETVLAINEERKDPLYVRWQYGLGRAGVFTSDAKSRWAEGWVSWPGFDKFWINVTRELLAHSNQTETAAEFDEANENLLVTYRLGAETPAPERIPQMYVLGPKGFEKSMSLERIADRVYRGRLHTGHVEGLFRIRPAEESTLFPELGAYAENQESRDYGANEPLLRTLALGTGGEFNPVPNRVFDDRGHTLYSTWELWPALLGLAIALTVVELTLRKWGGVRQFVSSSLLRRA